MLILKKKKRWLTLCESVKSVKNRYFLFFSSTQSHSAALRQTNFLQPGKAILRRSLKDTDFIILVQVPQNAVIPPNFFQKRKPTFLTIIKPSHINTTFSRPNGGQGQKFLKSNSVFMVLDMYKMKKSQRNRYSLQVGRCTI